MRRPTAPPLPRRRGRVVVASLALLVVAMGCGDDETAPDFCARAAAVHEAGPVFPDASAATPRPSAAAVAALDALRDVAPDAIVGDLGVLLDTIEAIEASLATGADGDRELPYDPDAVDRARLRVLTVVDEACGIQLDASGPPTP